MDILSRKSERTKAAQTNIIYMFLIKAANIVINLAYVPLLFNTLEQERYGIWITISTIVAWIAFFDIGLGNGLRNKLAEAVAVRDYRLAKKYISTTYVTLGGACIIFGSICLLIIRHCNWVSILNAPSISSHELQVLMIWVTCSLILQIFLKLINSILYALQRPAFSSFILMLSQLLAFLGVFIYSQKNSCPSLLELGIIISVAPIIVLFLVSLILFRTTLIAYSPSLRYFDKTKISDIFILGTKFFWIQLTSLFLFQSNSFIIAHVSGNTAVAEYNIAYKYIGLTEMIFAIIASPFWSATTEAYKKEDWSWINGILEKLGKISFLVLLAGFLLIFVSELAYTYWLNSAIKPDKILLLMLLIFFAIQLTWIRYGSIINGIGYIKLQFYITLIEGIVHIPLAFLLGSYWGSKGVIMSLILVTFANIFWPKIQIKNIAKKKKGIWTQ